MIFVLDMSYLCKINGFYFRIQFVHTDPGIAIATQQIIDNIYKESRSLKTWMTYYFKSILIHIFPITYTLCTYGSSCFKDFKFHMCVF